MVGEILSEEFVPGTSFPDPERGDDDEDGDNGEQNRLGRAPVAESLGVKIVSLLPGTETFSPEAVRDRALRIVDQTAGARAVAGFLQPRAGGEEDEGDDDWVWRNNPQAGNPWTTGGEGTPGGPGHDRDGEDVEGESTEDDGQTN